MLKHLPEILSSPTNLAFPICLTSSISLSSSISLASPTLADVTSLHAVDGDRVPAVDGHLGRHPAGADPGRCQGCGGCQGQCGGGQGFFGPHGVDDTQPATRPHRPM